MSICLYASLFLMKVGVQRDSKFPHPWKSIEGTPQPSFASLSGTWWRTTQPSRLSRNGWGQVHVAMLPRHARLYLLCSRHIFHPRSIQVLWAFQDPKMEVLYHTKPSFLGMHIPLQPLQSPYTGFLYLISPIFVPELAIDTILNPTP